MRPDVPEHVRLANVMQMYTNGQFGNGGPMPIAGVLCAEVARLRNELVVAGDRYITLKLMSDEINASLNYERSRTFWQKLKGLFE